MFRTTGLLFALSAMVFAETQSGIARSGGQPIPGAAVTAVCGTDRISTVTDDAGRFDLGGLPSTSCKFYITMFGFEPAQRDLTASATSATFDLNLQTRATLATEPVVSKLTPPTASPAGAEQTPAQTTPGGRRGPGRGGPGRGGFAGGPGRGGFPGAQGAAQGGGQNAAAAASGRGGGRGFQNLSLVQNGDNPLDTGDIAPSLNGATEDVSGSNEAFLVNGSLSQGVQAQPGDNFGLGGRGGFNPNGNGFNNDGANPFGGQNGDGGTPSLAAGAPGGGGGGGGRGGGGFGGGGGGRGGGGFGGRGGGRGGRGQAPNRNLQFGNRINRGRGRQFSGNAYYTIGNSVLNARPYTFTAPTTLTGAQQPKAGYAANRFGVSMGGPLSIPHVYSGDKTFWFVNYTGNRSKNGFDDITTVPTLAERQGDFSGINTIVNMPFTTTPFPGNKIPLSLDTAALGLLPFIPLPNTPGLRNNYQLIGANPTNNDNLQTRINQTLTAKDGLDINFNYQHRNSDNIQPFGFRDPSSGYGLSTSLTYRRTISRSLINSVVWNFSRNWSQTLSPFSFGTNIEQQLGITGVSTDPAAYGPPTIGFTNFGSLSDATPSLNRSQTSAENEQLIWIHGKQTVTFGFGVQRRQNNTQTDANGRGTFSFTGIATGYDFADFLLSLPQSTSVVRYTDNSRYLRETTLNGFVTDDIRLRSNLTINAGLRWEYFAPYTEKNGDMANLALTPGFTSVSLVLPGQSGYPGGLIYPDHKLFSPRIGIAWKPWKNRQIVVRSGYGIYYNGGVYGQLASNMVGQPPFAQTATLQTSTLAPLTLEAGFPPVPSLTIANTFAVDPNYHPGYAQQWTTSIQETIGRGYVIQVAYNGTKGTDLDVLQLPNRALPGNPLTAQQRLLIADASEFTYDTSVGNSTYNAAQVNFTRRFGRGTSFQLLYTFSKAIDDSSTLGGGAVLIPNDLRAERALSPTDQRHVLRMNYNYVSQIGNMRTGFLANIMRGWTLAGGLNATSGTPFTAVVTGDPSGTGYSGNSRAEATGLPVTNGSGYFNPLAFTTPATGTFGDAGRDTIPGIPNFSMNASFFRSFRLDDKRRIEFRIDSTNPINHPYVTGINTTVNSIEQYGLPVRAGAMRSMTATVRIRF
jgi:hypothetical protein